MPRKGGTTYKDEDGKITSQTPATRPAGSKAPRKAASAVPPEAAGGAAGDGGQPDRPSPAATKRTPARK